MPISKSAKKALRTAQAKRQRNITLKTKLKKTIKKASATNINICAGHEANNRKHRAHEERKQPRATTE